MRRPSAVTPAALVGLALLLGACTGGSDPAPTPTRSSTAATASASPSPGGPAPVWSQLVSYPGTTLQKAQLSVYPVQRVGGRLLLTVDSALQGSGAAALPQGRQFCTRIVCNDLGGVSLVDSAGRYRYGPLQDGTGGPLFTSHVTATMIKPGSSYRFGAFFADPGTDVTSIDVDLPGWGVVTGVPIAATGTPAAGLVVPTDTAEARTGTEGVRSGSTETWPVRTPGADALANKHRLLTRTAGGTVTKSGDQVSLNADVLFAFDKATLTGKAQGILAKAAGDIAEAADESRPVQVTGYTDAKGSESYNLGLSRRRAEAVRTALLKQSALKGFQLRAAGKGKADPVAPNTVNGKDNPSGRALNRRVEVVFDPKPVAEPSPAATAAPSPGASAAPSATTSGDVRGVKVTASVQPVQRSGDLSVVRLTLQADAMIVPVGQFSNDCTTCTDLSGFRLRDPAGGEVFVPAVDKDDRTRYLTTITSRIDPGAEYSYGFVTGGLPSGLSEVQVVLGQLGTVTVPVQG